MNTARVPVPPVAKESPEFTDLKKRPESRPVEGTHMTTLIKVRPQDCDYPSQPRSKLDPDYCRGLGENMKAIGQKVAIPMRGERFLKVSRTR